MTSAHKQDIVFDIKYQSIKILYREINEGVTHFVKMFKFSTILIDTGVKVGVRPEELGGWDQRALRVWGLGIPLWSEWGKVEEVEEVEETEIQRELGDFAHKFDIFDELLDYLKVIIPDNKLKLLLDIIEVAVNHIVGLYYAF